MEKLLEEISFDGPDLRKTVKVDAAYGIKQPRIVKRLRFIGGDKNSLAFKHDLRYIIMPKR
jgi:hypothetical protein